MHECILVSLKTGKQYYFDTAVDASKFLNHYPGYIRECLKKKRKITNKITRELFTATLGELKYSVTTKFSNTTICWDCQKANGKCSWSKKLAPVEGWNATPTLIKGGAGLESSFTVHSCPEFIRD